MMMNRYSNARHARAPMLESGAFLLKSLISFGAYLSPEADAVIEQGREPRTDSCQTGCVTMSSRGATGDVAISHLRGDCFV